MLSYPSDPIYEIVALATMFKEAFGSGEVPSPEDEVMKRLRGITFRLANVARKYFDPDEVREVFALQAKAQTPPKAICEALSPEIRDYVYEAFGISLFEPASA